MMNAWRKGLNAYLPAMEGFDLETEGGFAEVSLRNLRKIVQSGRQPVTFYVAHRNVLVTFRSGETYLATGFAVGYKGVEVAAFAEFASENGFGDPDFNFAHCVALPEDYEGEVLLPLKGMGLYEGDDPSGA